MMADWIDKKTDEEKGRHKRGSKNSSGGQQMQNKNQADKNESADGEQSLKKRFKCFNCGEDHYINNCLEFL